MFNKYSIMAYGRTVFGAIFIKNKEIVTAMAFFENDEIL